MSFRPTRDAVLVRAPSALAVATLVALAAFLGGATTARAAAAEGSVIARAAAALATTPVYVDPNAEKTISRAEAERLRTEIETRGEGPIYIGVLPTAALDEAGGDASGVIDELHRRLGRRGVYAVVAGGHFRAESTDLGRGEAGKLASAAFRAHHDEGIGPTLVDFVDRVGDARTGSGGGGGGSGHSFGRIGLLPIVLLAGLAFLGYRRFRRSRVEEAEFADLRETARQDLVALAEDVQGLERRVEANPAARRDYDAALQQYERASGAFDRVRRARDLAPVAEALEEGRYLMASAEARLEGRDPPERRPPCFFDPRHGPSVRDVEWSPDGGAVRRVPACAACALRVESGFEPDARQVVVGGRSMPYWQAGPVFGGYFGGFFPGLLLGELLAAPLDVDASAGAVDGGDFGGDFGGGDFGGGDFGGGGGGDF